MKNQTWEIVNAILRRGDEPGLIAEWISGLEKWAATNGGQDAAALRLWLPHFQVRPFYTAEELSNLWPALKIALGMETKMTENPSPNRLANELEFHGLPKVLFATSPRSEKWFIVERCRYWKNRQLSDDQFREIANVF